MDCEEVDDIMEVDTSSSPPAPSSTTTATTTATNTTVTTTPTSSPLQQAGDLQRAYDTALASIGGGEVARDSPCAPFVLEKITEKPIIIPETAVPKVEEPAKGEILKPGFRTIRSAFTAVLVPKRPRGRPRKTQPENSAVILGNQPQEQATAAAAAAAMAQPSALSSSWGSTTGEEMDDIPESALDAVVEWSNAEVSFFSALFGTFGRDWKKISEVIYKTPVELYAYWKESSGFTAPVAPGTRFRIKEVCPCCSEDDAFRGSLWACESCGQRRHASCRCSRCDPSPVKSSRPNSATTPSPLVLPAPSRTESTSPFDIPQQPSTPVIYLCKAQGCVPFSNSRRFQIVDDPSRTLFYGSMLPKTNLMRHLQTCHKIQGEPLQSLVDSGTIQIMPQDRLLVYPVGVKQTKAVAAAAAAAAAAAVAAAPEAMDIEQEVDEAKLMSPFDGDSCDSTASSTASSISGYFSAMHVSAADEPGRMRTAALRSVLRRLRWGSRCGGCQALEAVCPASASCAPASRNPPPPSQISLCPPDSFPKLLAAGQSLPSAADLLRLAEERSRAVLEAVTGLVRECLRPCIGGGGLVPKGRSPRPAWVLSASSTCFDLFASVVPGFVLTWPSEEYHKIRAGDRCYFWSHGPDAGGFGGGGGSGSEPEIGFLIGVGRVVVGPRVVGSFGLVVKQVGEPGLGYRERITVHVDGVFAKNVPQSVLKKNQAFSTKHFVPTGPIGLVSLTSTQASELESIVSLRSGGFITPLEDGRAAAEHYVATAPQTMRRSNDPTTRAALAWLQDARLISPEGAGFRLCANIRDMRQLRAVVSRLRARQERRPQSPGACCFCYSQDPDGSALVSCSGDCGLSCHPSCASLLPGTQQQQQWTCPDCIDRLAIRLDTCRVCGKSPEGELVTCDACDAWFHLPCSKLPASPDLWLCKRCRISNNQAARCEVAIGCGEIAEHMAALLAAVAHLLRQRQSAKGRTPQQLQARIAAATETLRCARGIVADGAKRALAEWIVAVERHYRAAEARRLDEEPTRTPNITQNRKKRTPSAKSSSSSKRPQKKSKSDS